jgi:hypothetical protein
MSDSLIAMAVLAKSGSRLQNLHEASSKGGRNLAIA